MSPFHHLVFILVHVFDSLIQNSTQLRLVEVIAIVCKGKNCNKQSSFISSFKYLCKAAVDWVNGIITISGNSDQAKFC